MPQDLEDQVLCQDHCERVRLQTAESLQTTPVLNLGNKISQDSYCYRVVVGAGVPSWLADAQERALRH